MSLLTIGALAKEAGMTPSALRYYETMGLLMPAKRVNGRRFYAADAFQRLAIIHYAQQVGFTIAEMQVLLQGSAPGQTATAQWRSMAVQKLPQLDALISRAMMMKQVIEASLQCGCLTLESCPLIEATAHASSEDA